MTSKRDFLHTGLAVLQVHCQALARHPDILGNVHYAGRSICFGAHAQRLATVEEAGALARRLGGGQRICCYPIARSSRVRSSLIVLVPAVTSLAVVVVVAV